MRKIFSLFLILIIGCTSNPTFTDGTVFNAGVYIPYEGSLYGCQIVSYVNGCRVQVPTNDNFEIERKHSSTNSYFFGMFETMESSDTKIKIIEK